MTTTTGRSSETRRAGRSVGQWLLGLLIILALVASVLMIFTDNLSVTGSLAVIAALWAAVIGAILVTRFRKQAETADAKSRDLRLVYELQLEREISARRQYELDVEATIRKEVAAESGAELTALKEQVVSLRSSLERLLGEALPDDQVALPNEKLRELASGLGGADLDPHPYRAYESPEPYTPGQYTPEGFGAHDDGLLAARDFAQTAPSASDGRHVEKPVDPNEMTEVIPVVTDDPLSGRIVRDQSAGYVYAAADFATVKDDAPAAEAAEAELDIAEAEIADLGGLDAGDEQVSAESVVAATPQFVDDTPTDEWERQAPAEPDDAPAWVSGRHETTVGATAVFAGGRRRRAEESADPVGAPVGRQEAAGQDGAGQDGAGQDIAGQSVTGPDTDFDNAHSNGLPVSELLRQLRGADRGSGGRRRRD